MVEITNELVVYMSKFKDTFSDIVPLRELPQTTSAEDIIEAIKKSIDEGQNLLPKIFGYEKLENDKNIII